MGGCVFGRFILSDDLELSIVSFPDLFFIGVYGLGFYSLIRNGVVFEF